jgi:hypothetical protein
MRVVTLVSWLLTMGLGSFMLHTWLTRGGLRRTRERPGGLPPALIFGHVAGAGGGLLLWIAFVVTGAHPLAWAAVGALMTTVALGLCTVTLWTPYPARHPGERRTAEAGRGRPGSAADAVPDDDQFQVTDEMIAQLLTDSLPVRRPPPIRPDPAVLVPVAHGFGAIATFVLAVMSVLS